MPIKLELAVEEIDYILQLLGTKPFMEVNDLITKIREQGLPQVNQLEEQTNLEEIE